MYHKETIETHKGSITLTAENFTSPTTPAGDVEVSVWGQVGGRGNPIYPPRSSGQKGVAQFGGVDGYLNSQEARQLFWYISIGQYLGFVERAKKAFLTAA